MRGRAFDEKDNDKAPPVVMINEALARAWYFPKADPIGQRLKLPVAGNPSSFAWNTVVGVVADVRTESLARADVPQIYLDLYQTAERRLSIFLRGRFILLRSR